MTTKYCGRLYINVIYKMEGLHLPEYVICKFEQIYTSFSSKEISRMLTSKWGYDKFMEWYADNTIVLGEEN